MINEEELMGLLIKDKRIGRTGFGAIVENIEQLAKENKGKYISITTLEKIVQEKDITIKQLKGLGYELGEAVSNIWIPCSERLLEQTEKVLVVTDKGCYYIARLNTKK